MADDKRRRLLGVRHEFLKGGIMLMLMTAALALLNVWWYPEIELSASVENRLSLGEVLNRQLNGEEILWLDARDRGAYLEAHIPGAIWLSEDDWAEGLDVFLLRWQPESLVVVYCGGEECASSERVASRLRSELGEGRIYVLQGGWRAWAGR